jgi:spore coat polysaccharide biosynthesis predicted glycosyltransferase SpsG
MTRASLCGLTAVFRPDSASGDGLGHLRRSSSLAQALASLGVFCRFKVATRQAEDLLAEAGHSLIDATGRIGSPDIIVVDSYHLEAESYLAFHQQCRMLVVIDDLSNRAISADIHINHNLFAEALDHDLVAAPVRLLGPEYALIDPRLPALRNSRGRAGILVSFGGTDDGSLGVPAARAIRVAGVTDPIYLVVSPLRAVSSMALELAEADPTISVCHGPDMVQLMAQCDLYIGAAGHTTLEAATAGLSVICVIIAENQRLNAIALTSLGEIVLEETTPELIVEAVRARRGGNSALHRRMDGQGAMRAAQAIISYVEGSDLWRSERRP